ncbi:hypothetical protein LJC37_05560 [Bacteroidales bacterium OttesenSCG-928-E04]|nr:hypothetical protein [Bacteroidales bacterium OttesenSCG-928-E04]
MKVFISGSISIKSLDEKDKTVLDQIVEKNDTVLIGDAFGIDKAVQEYLFAQDYQNVVLYFSGEKVRNNIGDWQTKPQPNPGNFTGRDFYQIKDKAMTIDLKLAASSDLEMIYFQT